MDHFTCEVVHPTSQPNPTKHDQSHGRGQGVVHGLAVALLHFLADRLEGRQNSARGPWRFTMGHFIHRG